MKDVGPGGAARHIAPGSNFRELLDNEDGFAGTSEDAIAYLKEFEENYPGLEHIVLGFPMGASAAQFKEQLTRFAEEVFPSFR